MFCCARNQSGLGGSGHLVVVGANVVVARPKARGLVGWTASISGTICAGWTEGGREEATQASIGEEVHQEQQGHLQLPGCEWRLRWLVREYNLKPPQTT